MIEIINSIIKEDIRWKPLNIGDQFEGKQSSPIAIEPVKKFRGISKGTVIYVGYFDL